MGILAPALLANGTRTVTTFTATSSDAIPGSSSSGIPVTSTSAMKIAAVYACVTVIAETTGMVPFQVFERVGEDGKRVARNHPLYELLHDQPNDYQDAMAFREMMTAFALMRRFAIAEIRPGPRGFVDQLVPLHPDLVVEDFDQRGNPFYRYWDPRTRENRTLLPDEVFILRGRFGTSVLDYARDSFGLNLAMQQHLASLFRRGMRPSSVVTHPRALSDPARENLRKGLDAYTIGGEREGRPLLLEEGMTYTAMAMTNEQAQLVSLGQVSVADIARWFRVPLHKIQELLRATNNNIERQSIDYVQDTVMPWCVRWEQATRRQLILAKDRFFAEHQLDMLLRGDQKARYEAYAVGRQWGWLSTNDIRRLENLNPIEGGDDDYLTPLNMTTERGALAFAPPARPVVAKLRLMVHEAAGRVVRKEIGALGKLAEKTGGKGPEWAEGVRAFYREHAEFAARLLMVDAGVADRYCAGRETRLLTAGPSALDDPETSTVADLTEAVMDGSSVLALPAAA
jgi:HK97 family phage portal protein